MLPPHGLLSLCAVCIYLFLYAPLLVLMAFSFTPSEYSRALGGIHVALVPGRVAESAHPGGAARKPDGVHSGRADRHGYWHYDGAGACIGPASLAKTCCRVSSIFPLIMPSLVIGIALLLFFVAINLPLGVLTIILAHIAFSIPLTTLVILARMQRLDPTLEEAAMDLGADEWTTFWRVTLPLLRPGIVAAALLAFPWSFNDFVITFFVAGVGASTLPLRIYSMIRLGVSPMVNALGTLIVVIPLLVVILGTLVAQRRV